MSGKATTARLTAFYLKTAWNSRMIAFFALMFLLSVFLYFSMPVLTPDVSSVFPPVSLSVVDLDDSVFSHELVRQLSDIDLINDVIVENIDSAQARLAANEVLLVLVLPENLYEMSMRTEERPPVEVWLNSRQPVESALFVRFMNNMASTIEQVQASFFAYADHLRPLYSSDETDTLNQLLSRESISVIYEVVGRREIIDVEESSKLNTIYFVISSMICLLTMQTSLLLLSQIQQERTGGIRERLVLAGVRWWQVLTARLATGLVWLTAGFTPLLAGLFTAFPASSRISLVLSILALYLITTLLCFAVGYAGRPDDKLLLGAWLGIMAFMLLGGCIYPQALLPDAVKAVGQLTPAYWTSQAIYNALADQPAARMTSPALLAMIAAAAAAAAFSWQKASIARRTGGAE